MEPWLIRAARMHPDRTALEATDRTWTYAQLVAAAARVAGALHADGVVSGERVALELPSAELVVALHGCLLLGATAVPVDLRLPEGERARRRTGAARVLTALPVGLPLPLCGLHLDPEAAATVMFTSGTTAGPKPVVLTVANWLWNAIGSATALGLDPAERWLCPMPLAHVGGLAIALRSAVYGTTVVLHDRFDTERTLAALADPAARITLVSLVPTMLGRLLDAGLAAPPTLRRVLLGGAPIAPSLLRRAAAAEVPVTGSFGMTETGSQIAADGFPLLGAELRIAERGELLVRGPSVAAGALSPDGWLHTGDLAALAPDGRLTIVGRMGDTIVTGGENVAPAEVEAVLAAHPAIADVAVLGEPDPEWGERVVARIVGRDRARPDDDALRAHCAAELAPFQVPKAYVWVDSVPRTSTGKLLRRRLR